MIDATPPTKSKLSPRKLPSGRLEQLLHGLQVRTSRSAQQLAEHIDRLNAEVQQLESQHQAELEQIALFHRNKSEGTLTEWDLQRMQAWDQAELRSYRAIVDSHRQEQALRDRAKAESEHLMAEANKKLGQIEKQNLQSIETANQNLTTLEQRCTNISGAIASVEQAAGTALAQHSLPVPVVDVPILPMEDDPTSSQRALAQADTAIRTAYQHVRQIEHMPLIEFFASAKWWALCAAVFVGSGMVLSVAGMKPVLALAVAAGITAVMVISALVGVRPWLKRGAAAEYPKMVGRLQLATLYRQRANELAIAEHNAALRNAADKRDRQFEELNKWKNTHIEEIKDRTIKAIADLRAKAHSEKQIAASMLTDGLKEVDRQFTERVNSENLTAEATTADAKEIFSETRCRLKDQIDRLGHNGLARFQSAVNRAMEFVARGQRWCENQFPSWNRLVSDASQWKPLAEEPALPLGSIQISQTAVPSTLTADSSELLRSQLDELHRQKAVWLFSPLDDNYLVIHGDAAAPPIKELVRNLLMRALTVLPAGKTQVCVVDPQGLGRDVGWLMALGDFDPTLVSHRVWTQSSHIARQIQNLASSAEDFIQQSLRNQYPSIVEYNADAGAMAEPYRVLVWCGLPDGLDDQSWKNLKSILDTGARCGIIPILIVDPVGSWNESQQETIQRRGLHVRLDEHGTFQIESTHNSTKLTLHPEIAPTESQTNAIIDQLGARAIAASRMEVPLANMLDFFHPVADNNHPDIPGANGLSTPSDLAIIQGELAQSQCWQATSSRNLDIPIGQSGVGRTHSMKLGVGTAQHAIIAGKTGSGKSSLLHALITSALLKYSPDQLRLVLLDFKKGVEFQVYSDCEIPHADIIGIESHREFGLSALQYVDDCIGRRGELFRSAGAQDIASWNTAHPNQSIPRMMVVVDEFQELFVEDDKLSQTAGMILDRIVRQGRSFGVHAVLSSQTLAGSYSLLRSTLGQMAVRIALQCDPSDAQIIFNDDNPAAARLKYPGQAVYNAEGGRIEGNQPMQIGWLDKPTQLTWFAGLPKGYINGDTTTNRLGRTVVFDGNRAATWNAQVVDMAIAQAKQKVNANAIWCATGESVAISPAVVFPLTNQAGRNILMVGGNDAMASSVMDLVTNCFVRASSSQGQTPQLVVVQGAKPTDARALALPARWTCLNGCSASVSGDRTAGETIANVHAWLQQRMAEDSQASSPVLMHLIQLGRLRSLRRDEDFSFSQTGSTPDKQLEEILRDGPSHGIFTLIWAESFSTVGRWLSRSSLRELEIRLLMQMSSGDSSNLIDSVAASRLGEHVMLLYDEATGQEQKFRPFSWETMA